MSDHFEWVDVGALIERERDVARLNSPYNALSANPDAHVYIPSQPAVSFNWPHQSDRSDILKSARERFATAEAAAQAIRQGYAADLAYYGPIPSPTLWTRIKGWLGL